MSVTGSSGVSAIQCIEVNGGVYLHISGIMMLDISCGRYT